MDKLVGNLCCDHHVRIPEELRALEMHEHFENGRGRVLRRIDDASTWAVPASPGEFGPNSLEGSCGVLSLGQAKSLQLKTPYSMRVRRAETRMLPASFWA